MHNQHPVGGEAVHVAIRVLPFGRFLLKQVVTVNISEQRGFICAFSFTLTPRNMFLDESKPAA